MIFGVVAARDRLLDELAELLLDQLRVLLADGFAQHVGFGERDAREHLRDTHHLLLIGDDAVASARRIGSSSGSAYVTGSSPRLRRM